MFKKIPGTKDILPEESYSWQNLENIGRKIFSCYNYQEIRLPLIEEASLFDRTLGISSEIVQKQMFLVRHGKNLFALRPEGTAPIVRAYLENNLDKTVKFIKLYYLGPMFRLERPQKGRLRQFHHLGCEVIGSTDPYVDVEIISLADNLLKNFSINGYEIKINSLGCKQDKERWAEILRRQLTPHANRLCADCKVRIKKNVLRILDCKKPGCREMVRGLDLKKESYLCPDCLMHFGKVKEGLDLLKINYKVTPHLVRGLDYYTRTVFEITHTDLGSQDALGAGGRYDNLAQELGGPQIGAMGFAFGMERLLLVSRCKDINASSKNLVYVIPLEEEAKKQALRLLDNLRKQEITADMDYENKSLKGAMRKANDLGAKFVVIIGEDELKKDVVTLKDMVLGQQRQVKRQDLILNIKKQISNRLI
ncbi:MAG: histidine--tRNA ligase [Candidatus Omnitrophica bacterium]|nr:histidine--tRNA ligase [Candidatus Omnitrophota bacterium]